jgi:hypothetical protein
MDNETKTYLAAMEARIDGGMNRMEERIAALIAGEIGTLHSDMGERFARVDTRLESIDTRLKLQAGLIQAGARAMARFSEFADNSEARWLGYSETLAELGRRVAKLEAKQ